MHCSMPLKIAKKSKAVGRGVASGGRGGRVRIRWQGERQPALEARNRAK